MKIWIKSEEVIKLMKSGWELGHSCGAGSSGRYWLQKGKLCCGGESINVNAKTIFKMLRNNDIDYAPNLKNDSYWLKRFKLK